MGRLGEIPAMAVMEGPGDRYPIHDPVGPLLLVEQSSDGSVRQHSLASEEALSLAVEQILNRDPTTSVRVFRLQELAINRYQEYRVELK